MASRPHSQYDTALQFLLGRINYERWTPTHWTSAELKLESMRELLSRLGNPLDAMPVVHVAGTKGKGSTAAMIAAVLTAAGYRTGLFSSPHLVRVEERMAVDGKSASEEEFLSLLNTIRPEVEAMDRSAARLPGSVGPTYFDITTAMAALHFRRKRAALAVLEVGMGGRLDSTNVCSPLVSVITSISLDHTQQLGETLAAIAQEKAGIIKPNVPVISGVEVAEARDVIREVAGQHQCELLELKRDFEFRYRPPRQSSAMSASGQIDYLPIGGNTGAEHQDLELALIGRHQAANAATALATLAALGRRGWSIPEAAVRRGLATVRCPARVEVLSWWPTVILDAAHNPASTQALLETLNESFEPGRRILVFATSQDKDYREMLRQLLPAFDHVILTRYGSNPRGLALESLAAAAAQSKSHYSLAQDATAAWNQVRSLAAPDDLICVAGSFYLAAEMRAEIDANPLGCGYLHTREIA